jgi:ADP-ribose pyrophosphatase YjhB (NUDIX family)
MDKVPSTAKLVYKTLTGFKVFQWLQNIGKKTVTFELLQRHDTVQVIPVKDGYVYCALQEQPARPKYISLFGGAVEEGETPEFAGKRELLEESGFKAEELELFQVCNNIPRLDWSVYYYIARSFEIKEAQDDESEKIKVKKIPIREFISKVVLSSTSESEFKKHGLISLYLPTEAKRLQEVLEKSR